MRSIRILVVLAALIASGLVWATPSQAATPSCTHQIRVDFKALGVHSFVPVSSSGSGDCLMGQGVAHSGVTALQNMLKRCYRQSITADGIFGPKTKLALINAQKVMRVRADGVYGPVTAHAILWPLYLGNGAFWTC